MIQTFNNFRTRLSQRFQPYTILLNAISTIAKKTRHYYCFAIFIISVLVGCSKQNSTSTPLANPSFVVTVVEKSTNKPIAGATVSLQKCSFYDIQFGCTSYNTFAALTTNAEGKITYSGNSRIDKIKVDANKYWKRYEESRTDKITLTPKTSIEVNVKRENIYAPTDGLWIGQGRFFNDLKAIGLPVDTIVYIDGYGYSDNKIYWYINYFNGGIINVGSTGGSTDNFFINGFDTARIQIKY